MVPAIRGILPRGSGAVLGPNLRLQLLEIWIREIGGPELLVVPQVKPIDTVGREVDAAETPQRKSIGIYAPAWLAIR